MKKIEKITTRSRERAKKKIKDAPPLWTYDCETDPFSFGRVPKPFLFCAVCESGEKFFAFGDDCVDKFLEFVKSQGVSLWLAHNGGKFDIFMLQREILGNVLLVDGRILQCKIFDAEFRDSIAILPMPLAKLDKSESGKLKIDMAMLEKNCREKNKAEIIRYCFRDCEVLLTAVQNFYTMAGRRALTIAGVASKKLREYYPDLQKINGYTNGAIHFEEFSQFFYGGRVGVLKNTGEFSGKFKLYDVNSMYPAVMRNFQHPHGTAYKIIKYTKDAAQNEKNIGFFKGAVISTGCFPVRDEKGNTPYTKGQCAVAITLHELRTALKYNLCQVLSGVLIIAGNSTNFSKFVDFYYSARQKAKKEKDAGGELFYKLILNSAYGRFAMTPDGRDEVKICEKDELAFTDEGVKIKECDDIYTIKFVDMVNEKIIIKRPVKRPHQFFEDVATGASITGAARAVLMEAIHLSKNPLYCDTDSLLCEELFLPEDNTTLGGWKKEAECDKVFIGGKKLYALYKKCHVVKKASKGVRISAKDIARVARGAMVTYKKDAPAFSLEGARFIERRIRKT